MAIEETMVIYDYFREGLLAGDVDWDADTIVAKALDFNYIPSATTHQYLSDVDAGAVIATSAALAGKTTADGVAGASSTSITIPLGDTCVGILLVDTTVDVVEGGRLVCYIGKDNEGNNLSIEGTGDAVTFRFDGATARILSV